MNITSILPRFFERVANAKPGGNVTLYSRGEQRVNEMHTTVFNTFESHSKRNVEAYLRGGYVFSEKRRNELKRQRKLSMGVNPVRLNNSLNKFASCIVWDYLDKKTHK